MKPVTAAGLFGSRCGARPATKGRSRLLTHGCLPNDSIHGSFLGSGSLLQVIRPAQDCEPIPHPPPYRAELRSGLVQESGEVEVEVIREQIGPSSILGMATKMEPGSVQHRPPYPASGVSKLRGVRAVETVKGPQYSKPRPPPLRLRQKSAVATRSRDAWKMHG